jgi:hypothetical protein
MTHDPHSDQLPPEIGEFIIRHVDSVAELEALLLTRNSGGAWDAQQVGSRLYISTNNAREVLNALHRERFLDHAEGVFTYAPASPGLRASAEALAAAYPRFLIPITRLIHAKPSSSLRAFSDAFLLREPED